MPTRPYAPSQAHLQGTQSRHTKANLAKEPALCQRTGNTLRCDTDPHYRRPRRKGMRTTRGLAIVGRDKTRIATLGTLFNFGSSSTELDRTATT